MLFAESHDDLDRFLGALIQAEDGKVFALVRHLGAPEKGTEIWVSRSSRRPRSDLRTALELLGLEEDSLGWLAPDISNSPSRSGSAI